MNSHLSKTEYRIMEYFWSTGAVSYTHLTLPTT